MDTPEPETPWFEAGLAFECTRCGACCTGAPGFVWVNEEEIGRIADYLGETPEAFSGRYVRRVGGRYSLIERPGGDCIFWRKGQGCTVYAARPAQCQTWPFWPDNIETREAWEGVERACPGSGPGPGLHGRRDPGDGGEGAYLMSLDPATFRAPLLALYAEVDAEVRRLGPRCDLSGRCCRFEEYGHTLFVSAPEAALLVADAPSPARPLDDGATCPWQDDRGRCTAREARPIGCRVYFCDPAYVDKAAGVSEAFIARLKGLVGDLGLPWDYAPLHRHLRSHRDAGTLPSAPTSDTTSSMRISESGRG